MVVRLNEVHRDHILDATGAAYNSGKLQILDDQDTVLAELDPLPDPAFQSSSGGGPIQSDGWVLTNIATGAPDRFILESADGQQTRIGSAGPEGSGADMEIEGLDNGNIVENGTTSVTYSILQLIKLLDDFSSEPLGEGLPNNWELVWQDEDDEISFSVEDIDDVRTLKADLATTDDWAAIRFKPSNLSYGRDGFDLLVLVRIEGVPGHHGFCIGFGHDGTGINDLSHASFSWGNDGDLRFVEHINGSGNWLSDTISHPTVNSGDWIWMRVRVAPDGNQLEGKLWHDGSSEPESWETSDPSSDPVNDNIGFMLRGAEVYIGRFSAVPYGESHP